jgi:DNA replication ATP-dependent helicase Dna2
MDASATSVHAIGLPQPLEPTSSQTAGYFAALATLQNDLGRFVANEHFAQRDAMRRLWATPLSERVEFGRCIAGLGVVDQPAPNLWRLECEANDSRFREGDVVRVSRGDPQFPFMDGVVHAITDTHVEVRKWRDLSDDGCAVGQKGLCIDESFVDLEDGYRAAIEDLGKTEIGRTLILPLLRGDLRPKVDATDFDDAMARATEDGMNDRQAEAVAQAIGSDVCWLIHGPPGTGKTRVLAWIVSDLLAKGQRVLVTSFTHRAIDNLLTAVAERVPDSRKLAKVAPFKGGSLPASVEQREKFSELSFSKDSGGYVVGATPFSLRSSRLAGVDFDTVVVDEASQVTVPLAVMAMLAARKYIFAGDHRQLPPVTVSLVAEEAVSMSIFGRLVGRGFDTLLNVTHRLNEQLCHWPSDTFYFSSLHAHPRAASRRLALTRCAPNWAEALSPETCVVWLAVPHRGCRSVAGEEATLIADLLVALHGGGVAWDDLGVVVPFRRQARYLRQRLASRQPDRIAPPALTVDTVERMQGQEREVVVVSFTTSDEDFALRLEDFLFLPQRLNVAATRPRSKLILVASPHLLRFAESRVDHPGAACFASLLASAHRIDITLPETTC